MQVRLAGKRGYDSIFKYWALLPLVLVLATLVVYPLGRLIVMSLSQVRFDGGALVFRAVGAKNFRDIMSDFTAGIALRNTLVLAVTSTALEALFGLALALGVSYARRGNLTYRTIIFFPVLLPPIAIGVMWLLIYQFNYGLINMILALFGIQGPAWIGSIKLAFPAVVVVDVWHWTAFVFMILLAGIEALPHELSESARVDGATEMQIVRRIILPLLRPTIVIAVVMRMIFAFKVFDQIYLLTSGGPGNATQVISSYIVQVFFEQSRMGYAAALSLTTVGFISVTVFAFYRLQAYLARRGM